MIKDLFQISDKNLWSLIHDKYENKGGVYKIIAVQDGQKITVNRFLDADKDGVLYIGKATSFIVRVIQLKKSIAPDYNGTGHICGRRYKSNPKIAESFPYEVLFIELTESDKPEELERQLLTEYAKMFGEVPPLNAI